MTHHPARPAAAIVAVLALTACASTPPDAPAGPSPTSSTTSTPTANPQSPAPGPTTAPGVTDNGIAPDADAAADAVAATMWASDARTDMTPQAAAARAVQWMTPAYAAIATEPLPSGGGADWLELTEHQGYLVADVLDADDAVPDRPADSATTATRVRVITLTPQGVDGWTGEPRQLVATMTLVQHDGAWLVDAITVDVPLGASDEMQDYG